MMDEENAPIPNNNSQTIEPDQTPITTEPAVDQPVIANNSLPPVAEEKVKFSTIAGVVIMLIVILVVIYFATKKPVDQKVTNNEQNVSVSTTPEQGKINIIEEVKNDLNILGGGSEDIVYLKIKATAYLGNTQKSSGSENCALTFPVEREIDKKYDSPMINSVLALLQPLTPEEKEQGYVSAIPSGTILKYLKLDDSGNMSVNLSGNIGKVAGSCAVTAVKATIKDTLSQFSSVKSVIICIDDNCDDQKILQP